MPRSDRFGAQVVELNAILQRDAAQQGLAVIDVYSPVADRDGTWADGLTTDGIHANKAGSDKMAAAAVQQLPPLAS